MRYAIIEDNRVKEVIDFNPTGFFHNDIKWIEVPDDVIPNAIKKNNQWINQAPEVQVERQIIVVNVTSLTSDNTITEIPSSNELNCYAGSTVSLAFEMSDTSFNKWIPMTFKYLNRDIYSLVEVINGVGTATIKLPSNGKCITSTKIISNRINDSSNEFLMDDVIIYVYDA